MVFVRFLIITLLLFCLASVGYSKKSNKKSPYQNIVLSYYPNLSSIFLGRKVRKSELIKSSRLKFKEHGNRLIYKGDKGSASFWFSKNGFMSSARIRFKVSEKSITKEEKRLLDRYKRKISSTKFLRNPHSNVSEIIDDKKEVGISIYSSGTKSQTRVIELFFSEKYFR